MESRYQECKKEMCSSRARACIIANVEYGPERCMHGSMSRANDLITEEIEDFICSRTRLVLFIALVGLDPTTFGL